MGLNFYIKFALLLILSKHLIVLTKDIQVEVKPHPDDIRTKRDLNYELETDIVTPVRVTEDLTRIESKEQFRTKRSLLKDFENLESSNTELESPMYKLHAFGDDLILRLEKDKDLVAPSYMVSSSFSNKSNNQFNLKKESIPVKSCFYKGFVIGSPGSRVAVSVCGSLTGSFSTQEHEYFITPIEAKSFGGESVPHSIKRRSLVPRSAVGHPAACGVDEPRHRSRYEQTFKGNIIANGGNTRRLKRSVDESSSFDKNVIEFELERNFESELPSRKKRSFESRQHYIETMVFADVSMLQHHGDDLEHYILSIMMVANKVFSHPSLGSAIALSVVKIMILDEDSDSPKISRNAAHTLRNFCSWQKQFNNPDDNNPDHYDLAILLTKVNLCGDTCDTLGMAEVGAMCSIRRSCAIVEDDGLSSSYTIAHEVGHVLNMMHDDNRLCRANFAYDESSHVMSSTMERVDSAQPWSLCSKQAVIDFLEDGRGSCLLDKPQEPKVYPRDLPGAMYNVNAQCEMCFGSGASECPYMRECSRLWCQIPEGARSNQCHTKHFPRADGSSCAPGSHCIQGQCVLKEPQRPPINGGWGSWSQFGSCSRTCGGGVRMATRQCNNPVPQNGGDYCTGSRRNFQSCQTEDCPARLTNGQRIEHDFRSEQCASYDGQRFPSLGVKISSTWIPKYADVHPDDRCKLICQSQQTGTYVTLSDRVIDGTRCNQDTSDICVHGQCMPAGCDNVLSSKAKYNKCGLCDASNKLCRRVKGKYNKRQSGYSDVITFPKGAASIHVSQRGHKNEVHDGNYLALVNSAGNYLLNGGLTLSTVQKDIEVNGTVFHYTGVNVPQEKIHSTLPLKEPITLQILSLGLAGNKIWPPKIKYSYYIVRPKSKSKNKKLSKSPNKNRIENIKKMQATIEPEQASLNLQSTGNSRALEPRWTTGRWSKCKPYGNRKCGAGWKKRKVTCKIGKENSNGCDQANKPYYRLQCFSSSCPSAISTRKTHEITTSRRSSGFSIIHRYTQHNERPIWNAGLWGACSTSCGFGVKSRIVLCQTRSGRLLADTICDGRVRPSNDHRCKLQECV